MKSDELKPCPFCGGPGGVGEGHDGEWTAYCESECPADPAVYGNGRAKAIEAWNTRASGWIPVAERLPTEADMHHDEIWAWWPDEEPKRVAYQEGEWHDMADLLDGGFYPLKPPKYWRKIDLPPPPEDKP